MRRSKRPYRLELVHNSGDLRRAYATRYLTEDAHRDLAEYVEKLGYPCVVLQFGGAGTYFNDLIRNGQDVAPIWRNVIADCHALPAPKRSLILLHNFEGVESERFPEIPSNIKSWGLHNSGTYYCEIFEKLNGECPFLHLYWMRS